MHHMTLKKAVETYSPLLGLTEAEIKIEIAKDEKFTEDDVNEIYAAISSIPQTSISTPQAPINNIPKEEVKSSIKKFELWDAEAEFEFDVDKKTGRPFRVLKGVNKKGHTFKSVHHIEQHHADTLNAQVENSKQYYFEVN